MVKANQLIPIVYRAVSFTNSLQIHKASSIAVTQHLQPKANAFKISYYTKNPKEHGVVVALHLLMQNNS